MATITYYYNAGSDPAGEWVNFSNVIDASDASYGQLVVLRGHTSSQARLSSHSGSSIANWQITKVEVGFKHQEFTGVTKLYFQLYWNISTPGPSFSYPFRSSLTTDWTNITSVSGAPSPWTYNNIKDLDIRVWGANSDTVDSTLRLYIVYLRVTYTAMFYRKDGVTSQINVYKDNTGMTHYIAVRANGETLYVPCGTVGDAKQTPIRVQIGGTTYSVLSQR